MILPDPACPPPSNRGDTLTTQKTNLQLLPIRVLVDRLRLHLSTTAKNRPETLVRSVFGLKNYQPKKPKRGTQHLTLHRSWDEPHKTPGGIYYEAYTDPSSPSGATTVHIDLNPQTASSKLPQLLRWLSAHDMTIHTAHVDRIDLAFDFAVPRHEMSIRLPSRRKASLWLPSGGTVETAKSSVTPENIGWMLYDKIAEREAAGHVTDQEHLTRCELRIHPHKHLPKYQGKHSHFDFADIKTFDLPEKLGGTLIHMPVPHEKFSMTNDHSQYYKACQVIAEYDPLRARNMMVDYARSHGRTKELASDLADCLLETVPLGRIWTDSRGETWRQVENQFGIPGTRPRINISNQR